MRAQKHEYDLLRKEGYYYQVKNGCGWYYKGKWIGYNYKDAFNHRARREMKGENK